MPKTKGFLRTERLFYILQYLTNHDTATASELASHCQTSVRSIYRDMKSLEELGVYYQSEGRNGYKLLYQPVKTGGRLTNEEWMALTLFPMLSEGITSGDHPFHQAYRKGLEKVMSYVQQDGGLSSAGGGLGERIRLHARPKDSSQIKVMPSLLTAISENRVIDVTYYTIHRDRETERRLDPYYLVPREGHLYLVAYCHFRKDIRVFRLSRFQEVKVSEETFKIPRTFNIDDFLENRWSIIADDEETTFVVHFTEKAARYVLEGEFHVETKRELQKDKSLLLTVTVQSRQEFLRWVRSFGADAEVIKPESVRKQLSEEYKQMAERYGSGKH
ncbi:transcriptional regulator [Salipaludibacillus sp. CUR1]|uniref:helix-turn-helix transcriptional regulator n=1 Tax=Salipaludibacillus sp. CUR1 TaxID=2820003 RepID=UPI001E49EF50|nr:transcriptional regulator [Salipaludibacillus sp. CUR1]MCE7794027.1 transcriptional regulator [Salipaludibacillus sp. CUR1]